MYYLLKHGFFGLHDWKRQTVAFAGPQSFKAQSLPEDVLRELAFGVTTIIDECECGAIRVTKALGDHRLISIDSHSTNTA